MKEAFERHAPEWSFRYVTQPPVSEYIFYPRDLHWSKRKLISAYVTLRSFDPPYPTPR